MNTQKTLQKVIRSKEPKLLNIAFNQDQSCFAICSEKGFQVYSTDPMELKMERNFKNVAGHENKDNNNSGIGIVKMLYKTNYVALVGGGRKPKFPLNKLCIWDDLKKKNSITLEFKTPILNIHLSRTHIVVILKNLVLVYSFKITPELISKFETIDNELGISDLAITENSSILVFPGRIYGQLHIVDISSNYVGTGKLNGIGITNNTDRKSVSLIKAHKNPIKFVCLSPSGNLVASASELGTIIRVHDTKKFSLLYEFRRGLDSAIITDMKFSPNGSKLAVLSDKNTLHVFHVFGTEIQEENKTHILKNFPLFPNYFKSTWSFVSKNVGNDNDIINDVGTLGWSDNDSIIIIWSYKGIWEKYDIIVNNSIKYNSDSASGNNNIMDNDSKNVKWEIVKEGWRSVY